MGRYLAREIFELMRQRTAIVLAVAGLLVLVGASGAAAQDLLPSPDPTLMPWEDARIKMGPIFFNPIFNLKNVGIDTNVFNTTQFPVRDITGTVAMHSAGGVHFGNAFVFQITQETDYVWYRRYVSERSIDGSLNFKLELRTRPFHPWIIVDQTKSHDREGYEIDARAGRQIPSVDLGSDFHFGTRIGATAAVHTSQTTYSPGEEFNGIDLPTVLNEKSQSARASGRYELTDLTSILVGSEFSRDRFEVTHDRDSDSRYYFIGIETKKDAIVSGSGTLGYQTQTHVEAGVPDYRGVVGHGAFTAIVHDRVKLDLTGDRGLEDSYEVQYPFYIQQGGGASVTSRLNEHFDVITNAKAEWLLYTQLLDGVAPKRTDRNYVFDLGFGYFVGGANGTRDGLTVERAERLSAVPLTSYRTTRLLTNLKFSF